MRYEGEERYKQFVERLVTTDYEIVGVRVPKLRSMVKTFIKTNAWKDVLLQSPQYHEDVLLHSFIIAAAPITVVERQQRLEKFFPYMDNWQVVDGLCSSLKEAKREQNAYWEWLLTLRNTDQPYVIRFVIVMYLTYFLDEYYIDEVLQYVEQLKQDHYYIKMAIAWLISIAFIKDEHRVTKYLQTAQLEKWIYNKALQKITESHRVSMDTKSIVKNWKR